MKKQNQLWLAPRTILAILVLSGLSARGAAQEVEPTYKLTTGYFQYSGGDSQNGPATDTNLRRSERDGNLWLGYYNSWAHEVTQTRVGLDHTYTLSMLRLTPSLQLASAGAWTGSIYAESGETWFSGIGLGRTNLRDSLSLNFDPNDSYTVSGGYRWSEVTSAALVLIRDNRLNPDQQHLHLIYRVALPQQHRLTVDVLLKSGTIDGQYVERKGLTVTYDWAGWFGRIAYDPKTNFTSQDLVRLVAGARF